MIRVGVISDTHGLLRPEALGFLDGCDRIIHGGDIGGADLLTKLSALAPVTAVRGNNDTGRWARALKTTERLVVDQVSIHVLHDLGLLTLDPVAAGIQVVISGHSHKPLVQRRAGVLYVNPGSAGPRRFRLPICAAELRIDGKAASARIVPLVED